MSDFGSPRNLLPREPVRNPVPGFTFAWPIPRAETAGQQARPSKVSS